MTAGHSSEPASVPVSEGAESAPIVGLDDERRCHTGGHEDRAAFAVGTLHVGDEDFPDTAYCAACTRHCGDDEYDVDRVLYEGIGSLADFLFVAVRESERHSLAALDRSAVDEIARLVYECLTEHMDEIEGAQIAWTHPAKERRTIWLHTADQVEHWLDQTCHAGWDAE